MPQRLPRGSSNLKQRSPAARRETRRRIAEVEVTAETKPVKPRVVKKQQRTSRARSQFIYRARSFWFFFAQWRSWYDWRQSIQEACKKAFARLLLTSDTSVRDTILELIENAAEVDELAWAKMLPGGAFGARRRQPGIDVTVPAAGHRPHVDDVTCRPLSPVNLHCIIASNLTLTFFVLSLERFRQRALSNLYLKDILYAGRRVGADSTVPLLHCCDTTVTPLWWCAATGFRPNGV